MSTTPEPGAVVRVATTPRGRYAFGRVYAGGVVCFYTAGPSTGPDVTSDAASEPPLGVREFSFCTRLDDVVVPWEEVGRDPFVSPDDAELLPAPMLEKSGPHGPPQSLSSYLSDSRDLADRLVHAPDDHAVYRLGMELFQLGSRNGPEGDEAIAITGALRWIWGDLTDAVDAPYADPDTAEATRRMRRAAEEWLVVSDEPQARAQYLDRWEHDECGAPRPAR